MSQSFAFITFIQSLMNTCPMRSECVPNALDKISLCQQGGESFQPPGTACGKGSHRHRGDTINRF